MAKIICVTSGLTGILNASFELISRLEADGHQVLCAAPKEVESRFNFKKNPFIKLDPINTDANVDLPKFNGPLKKIKRFFYKQKNKQKRKAEALERIEPISFSKLVDRESPDFLIIDVELHEYILKAYAQPIPILLLSQWFTLWKSNQSPYLLSDTIPGEGWKGSKIGIEIAWRVVKLQRWWIFKKRKWLSGGTDRRSVLLDFAKQEQFPLKYIKENYWPGPFTYNTLPIISMTAKEMEFSAFQPPNLHYVGPMIYEDRIDQESKGLLSVTLDEILEYRKAHTASLIYCNLSTLSKGDHHFIAKLIKAVENNDKWILVISYGRKDMNRIVEDLPSNVFIFSYISQLKILRSADCSINHGGIHTINECILYKVPMIVYSGKRSDQNGCAARVQYHELGIMADKDNDQPADIEAKIRLILTDEKYLHRISEMRKCFIQYRKDNSLEKIVDKYLRLARTKKNKMGKYYSIIWLFMISLCLGSCTSYESLVNYNERPRIPQGPQAITNYQPIVIQPNDIIRVGVSSLDKEAASPFSLSGGTSDQQGANNFDTYLVNSNGDIDFPTIGKISLKGLKIEEAKDKIRSLLSPYFNQIPIIQLRLTNFRINVNGEVNGPGSFQVNSGRVTIIEAITLAGDFTNYARRDSILIIREQDGNRDFGYLTFNSADIFSSPYFYLQQNDVVYVQPSKAKVNAVRDPATRFLPWISALVSVIALSITIGRR